MEFDTLNFENSCVRIIDFLLMTFVYMRYAGAVAWATGSSAIIGGSGYNGRENCGAEITQNVAVAIYVLSGDSLAAGLVTPIDDWSCSLRSLAVDDIGTGKGIAYLPTQGLGVAG